MKVAALALLLVATACGGGASKSVSLLPSNTTGGLPIASPTLKLSGPAEYVLGDASKSFVYEQKGSLDVMVATDDEWSNRMAAMATQADQLLQYYDSAMPDLGWELVSQSPTSQPILQQGEGFLGVAVKSDARLWSRSSDAGDQFVLVWTQVVGTPDSDYLLHLGFVLCPPADLSVCQDGMAALDYTLIPSPS